MTVKGGAVKELPQKLKLGSDDVDLADERVEVAGRVYRAVLDDWVRRAGTPPRPGGGAADVEARSRRYVREVSMTIVVIQRHRRLRLARRSVLGPITGVDEKQILIV